MPPTISFSTVKNILRVDATLAHGITPSVIRIDFAEQKIPIATAGDLVIRFEGKTVTYKDCLIDQSSFQAGTTGQIKSLAVFDRRWKWRFQNTSFSFNVQNDADEIRIPPIAADMKQEGFSDNEVEQLRRFFSTKRDARRIALWLARFEMSDPLVANELPDDAFPEFAADNIRPAVALATLCDWYGCSIILQTNDEIAVRKLGKGRDLPDRKPLVSRTASVKLNVRPERVRVITAPIIYQYDFRLRAVGEELDGNFVPIDELSYKPSGGWESVSGTLNGYLDLTQNSEIAEKARPQAERSVWKSYRPIYRGGEDGVDAPIDIDGTTVLVYDQIAPLLNRLTTTVFEQGAKRNQKPLVYGQYQDLAKGSKNVEDADFEVPGAGADSLNSKSIVPGWRIIPQTDLVQFSQPMLLLEPARQAELFLRVGFYLKENQSRVHFRRHFDARIKPPIEAGVVQVQVVESLQPTVRFDFEKVSKDAGADGPLDLIGITDNSFSAIRAKTTPYLEAMRRKIQDDTGPKDVTYAGLVTDVELDGAIRSITWSLSTRGVFTRIQRNQDLGSSTTLSSRELRQIERSARVIELNDRVPSQRVRNRELERGQT